MNFSTLLLTLLINGAITDVYKRQEYIKTHTKKRPKIAVVLGSGLGKLTADFTDTEELSYNCLLYTSRCV